jgi:putative ABC transport system substrate-binding protein
MIVLAGVLAVTMVYCVKRSTTGTHTESKVTVGITAIVEHPLLVQAREGFVETLANSGYAEGRNIVFDYQNAHGRIDNANTIAAGFIGKAVDLIYSISTPSSQAVKEKTSSIPIVFAAVTDPVGAGLVASIESPGGNVTGMSDKIPVESQLSFIKTVLPDLKRLGIPYNAGEANSASLVREMRAIAPNLGIELVETTASQTADVGQAILGLVGRCDAVYMPTDNTMAAAVNVISDICMKNRLPFFSCEKETIVEDGALAALIVDHYRLGVEAARMAVRILEGKLDPAAIPVGTLNSHDIVINLRVAERLGVQVSQEARNSAEVIE